MNDKLKSKIEELKQKVALLKEHKKISFKSVLEKDFDSETLEQE